MRSPEIGGPEAGGNGAAVNEMAVNFPGQASIGEEGC